MVGTSQREVTGDQRPHIVFSSRSRRRASRQPIPVPRIGAQRVWVDLHIVEECAMSTYLQGIDIEDENLRIGIRHGI